MFNLDLPEEIKKCKIDMKGKTVVKASDIVDAGVTVISPDIVIATN